MGMGGVIDLMFLASGLYLVGTAVMTRRQGKIAANVMLAKGMTEKDIEDKEGFINYMYKKLMCSGVLIMIASLIHLVNDYYVGSNVLAWFGIVVLFIALVIYVYAYQNGRKLYMKGWVEMRQKEKEKLKKK